MIKEAVLVENNQIAEMRNDLNAGTVLVGLLASVCAFFVPFLSAMLVIIAINPPTVNAGTQFMLSVFGVTICAVGTSLFVPMIYRNVSLPFILRAEAVFGFVLGLIAALIV